MSHVSENDDSICTVCFESCVKNSTCARRYYQANGTFVDSDDASVSTHLSDFCLLHGDHDTCDCLDKFPICDRCTEQTKIETYADGSRSAADFYIVRKRRFKLEFVIRIND